uniref:Pco133413 n=1 Tax=Arundo donax TaxID=35708 RepID=A0A0A9A9B7_ARUDO
MASGPVAPLTTLAFRSDVPVPGSLHASSIPVTSCEDISECLVLDNVFDGSVKRDDEFYLDIRDHIHRSSLRCGPILHIHVDKKGLVYLRFDSKRSASKAMKKWHQSVHDGNLIAARYMDIIKYKSRF